VTVDPAGERRRTAQHHLDLGNDAFAGADWEGARAHYEAALPLFIELDDPGRIADVLTNLGNVAWRQGRLGEADQRYDQAAKGYAHVGADWHLAVLEQNRGNIAYQRGDLDAARARYKDASRRLAASGHHQDAADSEVNLGAVLSELGDHKEALRVLEQASQTYRDACPPHELPRKLAETNHNIGLALAALERHDAARAHLQAAADYYASAGLPEKTAEIRHNLGALALQAGELDQARSDYQAAADHFVQAGHEVPAADSYLGLGAAAWRQGDRQAARRHYALARDIYLRTEQWLALTWCEHNIGQTHDEPSQALEHLAPAWAAMQGLVSRLAQPDSRALWRQRVSNSAEEVLATALAAGNPLLAAEIIEALRGLVSVSFSSAAAPDATIGDDEFHEPLVGPPPVLDCGWTSQLTPILRHAETLIAASRSGMPLRVGTARLIPLLA
jgi:tetratricopeptide (TPR) repeat protein